MSLPEIIESCGPLLANYDVLLCDVWGVVHDGNVAHADAGVALAGFKARGGTVILVSNAPTPSENVARVLDQKGVRRDAWDAIVSSGDLALDHVRASRWTRVHHIGPPKRDRAFFAALGGPSVPVDEAQGITCTGLADDRSETPEAYRPLLQVALSRNLTFVCANPDLVVHVGDDLLPCAGSLAAIYEDMGGKVVWAGKPYPLAYDRALEQARKIRNQAIEPAKVLAIGDSIRTDLAAAAGAGVDALFIASGIHRSEAMNDGDISPSALARLFDGNGPPAIAAASALLP